MFGPDRFFWPIPKLSGLAKAIREEPKPESQSTNPADALSESLENLGCSVEKVEVLFHFPYWMWWWLLPPAPWHGLGLRIGKSAGIGGAISFWDLSTRLVFSSCSHALGSPFLSHSAVGAGTKKEDEESTESSEEPRVRWRERPVEFCMLF